MSGLSWFRIERHLRELVSGASIAFVCKALGAAATLGFHIILTRSLGPGEAGIVFLALTIATLCALIGRVGLDNALVRYIAAAAAESDWSSVKGVYRQGVAIAFGVSSVLLLALLVLSPWLSVQVFNKPELTVPLRWMALSVLSIAMMLLHAHSLRGMKRIFWASLLELQGLLLAGLATLCFLVLSPLGSTGAALAYALASASAAGIGMLLWRRATPQLAAQPAAFSKRKLLDTSIPLLWVAIMNFFIIWTGSLALGLWGSNEDISVFNVASRTAMLISFVLFAVNSIAAPKFAALHSQGAMEFLDRTARQATTLAALLGCPVLLVLIAFPDWVMSWFGPSFVDHGAVLVILALGQFVNVVTGPVGHLLIMCGYERQVRDNLVFASVLNLVLNLALVPAFGIVGAAIAAAVTLAVKNAVAAYLAWRNMGILIVPFLRRADLSGTP